MVWVRLDLSRQVGGGRGEEREREDDGGGKAYIDVFAAAALGQQVPDIYGRGTGGGEGAGHG